MESQMPLLCPEDSVTAEITDQETEKLFGILLAVTQQLIMNLKSKKRPIPCCIQPPPDHTRCCQPALPRASHTSHREAPTQGPPPHTRGCRTEQNQQHTHVAVQRRLLQLSPMLSPEMWQHLSTPSPSSSSPGSLLHILDCTAPSVLTDRGSSTPTALKAPLLRHALLPAGPTTPLPQADAPSSIRHRDPTCAHTRTHATSCPGLQHSTSRVSNSQDTA